MRLSMRRRNSLFRFPLIYRRSIYGPELVLNGGMETGNPPTGWSLFGIGSSHAQSTVQKHSGSNSDLVTVGSTYTGIVQPVDGVVGKTYRVSCYVYGLDMVGGSFYLNWDSQDLKSVAISNGAWVHLEGIRVRGAGVNNVQVYQYPVGSNAGKKFYVDDVSIQEVIFT